MNAKRKHHQRGFTIAEMIMVITVIGLVATTMAMTVREAMQAKIADATMSFSKAGGNGETFKFSGMKAYQPATQTANTTVKQNETTASGYDKGATNYSSALNVSRTGGEKTAGASSVSDDKAWLTTQW